MVIDFHTHIFPDKIAEKTIETLKGRSRLLAFTDGTLAGALRSMDFAGVDRSVVLSIATNARQNKNVNDFAIELDKNERITAFGSVHPEADWKYELDRLSDAGIRGIKLHPDYQGFYIDAENMRPIYEYILKKGFILSFHAGLDLGLPEPMHAPVERIARVMDMFCGERVVLAHMGGFMENEAVREKLLGRDIYIDTSFAPLYMPPSEYSAMLSAHRADRLLFATDLPWSSQAKSIELVKNADIPEETKEKILYKNALALLGLKA